MKPACTKICIITEDHIFASLLKEYLSRDPSLFIYTTTPDNILPNKDVYLLFTNKYMDLFKIRAVNGLKILITDSKKDVFLRHSLDSNITMVYDDTVNLDELIKAGLHFYIYQRGSCDVDYDEIVKIVTRNKNFKRRYGKIQI